eukprot:scaffold5387_cov251-Ochromonas_danica.AAC.12
MDFCLRDCESYGVVENSYHNCLTSFEAAYNISVTLKDCAQTWFARVVDATSGLSSVLDNFPPFQDEDYKNVLAESSKVMKEFDESQGLLKDALGACLRHAEGTLSMASLSKKTEVVAANPPLSQTTMHTFVSKKQVKEDFGAVYSLDNQISAANLNDTNDTEPIELIVPSNPSPSQPSNPNQMAIRTFSRVKSPGLLKEDFVTLHSVDNIISATKLNDQNETLRIHSGEASVASDSEERELIDARFQKNPSQSQTPSSRKSHVMHTTTITARTSNSNSSTLSNAVDRGYSIEKEIDIGKNEISKYFWEEEDSNEPIPQAIQSSAKNEKRKRESDIDEASDDGGSYVFDRWQENKDKKEGKRLRVSSDGQLADAFLSSPNRARFNTITSGSKGAISTKPPFPRASNGDDSSYEEQEEDHLSDSDYIGDEKLKNKWPKRPSKKGVHPPSLEKKVNKQKDKQQDSADKSQVEDKERKPRTTIESKVDKEKKTPQSSMVVDLTI